MYFLKNKYQIKNLYIYKFQINFSFKRMKAINFTKIEDNLKEFKEDILTLFILLIFFILNLQKINFCYNYI